MASEKSVSFRAHLLANTTDVLAEVDLHCARTARLIVSIISQLAAYTEEGTLLAPTVFVCNSISKLIQRAGAGEYIPLSGDEPSDVAAEKILKAAAPLIRLQNQIIYGAYWRPLRHRICKILNRVPEESWRITESKV